MVTPVPIVAPVPTVRLSPTSKSEILSVYAVKIPATSTFPLIV